MAIADILPILLAAVLAWAGCLNLAAPDFIREEFRAWGYSDQFRKAVGALEWIAAAALLIEPLRPIGCVIAIAIMLGVLVTLFRQRAFMRLEYPLVLLALLLLVARGR
jgi:uncharacterized membrane protein YphA (DoxX/SURF4 family)